MSRATPGISYDRRVARPAPSQSDDVLAAALPRSVFKDLPPEILGPALAGAMRLDIPAGSILYREDDPPRCGLLVSAGCARERAGASRYGRGRPIAGHLQFAVTCAIGCASRLEHCRRCRAQSGRHYAQFCGERIRLGATAHPASIAGSRHCAIRHGTAAALIVAWAGLWLHELVRVPATLGITIDGSLPFLAAAVGLIAWRNRPLGLVKGFGWLHFVGAVLTVLPLPLLPFASEQTLAHCVVHGLRAVAQIPLIAMRQSIHR